MRKPIPGSCFLIQFFIWISYGSIAQTTLISATGDGGFELGTTYAANGWTEVNGPPAQTNQWYCGTAATGFTGTRGAYIGTAPSNNTYNIGITSVVHFYRDVTFPAGQPNITLTFNWKGYGESGYDYIRVFLVPTSTTISAGSLLFTGQIGSDYNLNTTWQSATLTIPCSAVGTTQRLVFSWRNDVSIGNDPAGAIDNINLVSSAGWTCATALGSGVVTVPALPYNSGAGTTCGQGDDLTIANTTICGSTNYLTGEDRVFVFTPTTSGQVTISLNAPTASWTGLMLFDGCPVGGCGPGTGNCIAYAQDFLGSKSFCAPVTAGTTYYLILDSYAFPTCNAYTALTISAVATGSLGNTCATAVSIPSLPFAVAGQSTSCKGNEYSGATPGICNAGFSFGEDIVYAFTVSSAQCVGISLTGATSNDISFAIYQGGCPGAGGTCIGSGGGATSGSLTGSVNLPGAGTYYLIIDTQSPSNNVSFNLAMNSFGAGAANDLPYLAQSLPFNIPVGGNNSCSGTADEPIAQPSCFAPAGSNPMNTVWYSFISPSSGCVKIRTTLGTLSNTQIAVYGPVIGVVAAGAGNTLSPIGCNQDIPPCGFNSYPNSELSLTGLAPGSTYYIMVDGYGSMTGSFTIFLMDAGAGCNLPFPPVPGQDCSLAFPVCKTNINVPNPGPQAVGSNCEFTSGVNCLASGERGSFWYTVNIVANGFLEFDIVPNDWPGAPSLAATDYDFAVWKTKTAGTPGPANCSNLGTVAPITCNYSSLGVTGCNSATVGNSPGAYPGFGGAYMSRIAVNAGDQYIICVSNFSNSTSGFALNFPAGAPLATAPPAGGSLVWTGTLNTDWYNPENWGGCTAPNCVLNVSISGAPVNQPAVTGLTAVCGNLDVSLGATLTLQANSQLKICNNFINNGTVNALANSTLIMQSDSVVQNQSMTGVMTGTNKLWNLTINKPATAGGNTVTLNNNLDNAGNFVLGTAPSWTGGTFNINGMIHKVAGNFTVYYTAIPYSIYAASSGTTEFNGAVAQSYFNRGSLYNVVMNNTSTGLTLGNSGATDWMVLTGTLTMNQGKIITGANRVNILNTAPAASGPGNTTSFVDGFLKRSFAATGGSYDFPVGTALKGYQRINFNFGTSNDRTNALVSFNNTAPVVVLPFLGPECVSAVYDQAPLNNGYWQVSPIPSSGVAPYSVTAYNTNYTNAQSGFTLMTNYAPGSWALIGSCVAAAPITAVSRTGLTALVNFTQFATAQSLSPLPVELIYFDAKPAVKSIQLKWITSSELSNRGFEIWRATTPPDYDYIGWRDGNGTTSSTNIYEFDDKEVSDNINYYYILKQVDYDGLYDFSNVAMARLSSDGFAMTAMPNPYSGATRLTILLDQDADVNFTILSSLGQEVMVLKKGFLEAGTHHFEFSAAGSGFGNGVYTARIFVDGDAHFLRLMEIE